MDPIVPNGVGRDLAQTISRVSGAFFHVDEDRKVRVATLVCRFLMAFAVLPAKVGSRTSDPSYNRRSWNLSRGAQANQSCMLRGEFLAPHRNLEEDPRHTQALDELFPAPVVKHPATCAGDKKTKNRVSRRGRLERKRVLCSLSVSLIGASLDVGSSERLSHATIRRVDQG